MWHDNETTTDYLNFGLTTEIISTALSDVVACNELK